MVLDQLSSGNDTGQGPLTQVFNVGVPILVKVAYKLFLSLFNSVSQAGLAFNTKLPLRIDPVPLDAEGVNKL